MSKQVIMIKSCVVMAWGKSHSAPKGATLIFPDEIADGLVKGGMAVYYAPPVSTYEKATAKIENKQTRKGGK